MQDFYQQYPRAPTMDPPVDATIGQQVARSGVWSAGGQVVVLAGSLIATPFTIRLLGPSAYGLLAIVNAIVAYLTVLDLGMGSASTRFASQAYARHDSAGEAAIIWTATAIAAVPTTALAVLLCIFARPLAANVLHVGSDLQAAAEIAIRLGAAALVARVVAAVLNTSELVRLRWDLFVGINTGGSILQIAMIPVILALGHGVDAAVGMVFAAAAVTVLGHVVASTRLQPAMRVPRLDRRLVRPLLAFGGALVAANGLSLVLSNAERFLLAHFESVRAVGSYSVASNIAALLAVVPIALSQPLLPAFARLGATEEWARVGALYRRGVTYVLVAGLPLATAIAVVGRPFLRVWAGPEYSTHSTHPLWILLVGIVANAVTFLPYNLLLSIGATRVIARCHLVEVPLFAVYAPLLVDRFGAAGAAAAWSLHMTIAAVLVYRATARRAQVPSLPAIARPVLMIVPVLVVPLALLATTGEDLVAIVVAVPAVAAFARLAWSRVLDDDDRRRATNLLSRARTAAVHWRR